MNSVCISPLFRRVSKQRALSTFNAFLHNDNAINGVINRDNVISTNIGSINRSSSSTNYYSVFIHNKKKINNNTLTLQRRYVNNILKNDGNENNNNNSGSKLIYNSILFFSSLGFVIGSSLLSVYYYSEQNNQIKNVNNDNDYKHYINKITFSVFDYLQKGVVSFLEPETAHNLVRIINWITTSSSSHSEQTNK